MHRPPSWRDGHPAPPSPRPCRLLGAAARGSFARAKAPLSPKLLAAPASLLRGVRQAFPLCGASVRRGRAFFPCREKRRSISIGLGGRRASPIAPPVALSLSLVGLGVAARLRRAPSWRPHPFHSARRPTVGIAAPQSFEAGSPLCSESVASAKAPPFTLAARARYARNLDLFYSCCL